MTVEHSNCLKLLKDNIMKLDNAQITIIFILSIISVTVLISMSIDTYKTIKMAEQGYEFSKANNSYIRSTIQEHR